MKEKQGLSGKHPKILVINREPFNNVCGAGITMTNLFSGWPKEFLASIYWEHFRPEKNVCENFYLLTEKEMRWRFPFRGILSLKGRQEEKELIKYGESKDQSKSTGSILKAAVRKCWRFMIYKIGGLGFMIKSDISDELENWIKVFKPDIIYAVPTELSNIKFIKKAVDLTGASLVIHIYDDWPSIIGHGGMLEKVYGRKTLNAFVRLLGISQFRIAICNEMAEEYERRYGLKFLSFHNCPETNIWYKKINIAAEKRNKFVFRFIGDIYEDGNLSVLREFSDAVAYLQKKEISISLEIYSTVGTANEFKKEFDIKNAVSIYKVPNESREVASLYADADGLIMAYNFDDFSINRFRYSIATKFPAYLLSGTPILIYAHESLAVARRAVAEEIAYVIDQHLTVEQLSEKIIEFMNDRQMRIKTAEKGQKYALDYLTADAMRPRFQSVFTSIQN